MSERQHQREAEMSLIDTEHRRLERPAKRDLPEQATSPTASNDEPSEQATSPMASNDEPSEQATSLRTVADELSERIKARQSDKAFQAHLDDLMKRHKGTLDLLAEQ